MPIYMDRHDVSETVTAENVARLHQEDLKVQDKFGCRGLTYWYDDKRKTAFCLIEADNVSQIIEMHNHAHGETPNQIIEVDTGVVESFLGRIEDPVKAKGTELNIIDDSAFRIIMVINLKPSTPLKYNAQYNSLLENYRSIIVNVLIGFHGKIAKQNESNFLVSFRSVSCAVQAAFKIRVLLEESSANSKDQPCLKIGLSAGVPVTKKKSIFEDVIKLAERMCKVVKEEIIISSEVKELYDNENRKVLIEEEGVRCLTREDEAFLNLLMEFIESNWSRIDLKVEDLNKSIGYSKSQLYRKMILITGKSPNTLLNEYRLNEAFELLNKNTNNVSQIAYDTGFTSPSYFSKCFQKQYGHLPSQFLYKKTSDVLEK
jgi:AraC-like DNA-binding protein